MWKVRTFVTFDFLPVSMLGLLNSRDSRDPERPSGERSVTKCESGTRALAALAAVPAVTPARALVLRRPWAGPAGLGGARVVVVRLLLGLGGATPRRLAPVASGGTLPRSAVHRV
jgi:hypothetical protein